MSVIKPRSLLTVLLMLLILLIAIDIFTGFWYFNRQLEFDSTKFNNIATPIATIVTFLVVFFGLFVALEQNRINYGASIKPHFNEEKERIKALIEKLTQLDYGLGTTIYNVNYDGFNYVKGIQDSILRLINNEEYKQDSEIFKNFDISRDIQMINKKSYYGILMHLNGWAVSSVYFPFESIRDLLTEIKKSKMTSDDKRHLYLQIKNQLLFEYIYCIGFHSSIIISPEIPILYSGPHVEFKKLHETRFGDLYRWIETNIPTMLEKTVP